MTIKLSEDKYDKLQEEFNIWFAESGCDREFHSGSDVESMFYDYVTNELGSEDWEVVYD